jgi:hypothetical protein
LEVFGSRIINHGSWPACSPGLTSCDFYLWRIWKEKVYRTNPNTKNS